MIPVYAHTLVFVLAVTGLVGCVGRFDYNLVLALGWLYLGDLNRQITNSVGVILISYSSTFCFSARSSSTASPSSSPPGRARTSPSCSCLFSRS